MLMKRLFPALAILAIGTAAVPQTPPAKPKPTPKTITCPIMTKSKVDIAKATKTKMFADYKGRRYFFCCAGCPEAFKANPAKYAKMPSIPTPKKKKA